VEGPKWPFQALDTLAICGDNTEGTSFGTTKTTEMPVVRYYMR